MKRTLSISLLLITFFGANAQMAQGDFTFGVGLHLGLPTGNLNTSNSFGIGGEVQGEYNFLDNLTGVATSGYTNFFGKTVSYSAYGVSGSVKEPSAGQIPILVGARYYLAEQFFVGAQIGLGIWTGGSTSTSGFEYRPQVGFNADQFQLILHYDATSVTGGTLGYVGLTGVYKFGGNK